MIARYAKYVPATCIQHEARDMIGRQCRGMRHCAGLQPYLCYDAKKDDSKPAYASEDEQLLRTLAMYQHAISRSSKKREADM